MGAEAPEVALMDEAARKRNGRPGLQRFRLSVQRSRFLFFTFACAVGVLIELLGAIQVGLGFILVVWAIAVASSFLLYLFYSRWWRINLDPVWFFLDGALVTWAVYKTGGAGSPWFPWYVANVAGAAVSGGFGWALVVSVVNAASYLGLLVGMGEIAFGSPEFAHQLGLVLSLFCAPAFFLWGVVELQKKRNRIKQLEENERRKVEEMTRLTAALDQRTRELAEANVQVREADRLKSQFLANMSHELRTPLNSIIGFSEVLLGKLEGQIPEREHGFLNNIHSSGQHLLGIINDILDLSKIEAGRMEIVAEPFFLGTALRGVCTVMRGIADRRCITFELDLPPDLPPVEGDVVKVKQVFYNLFSNAVKFSPDGAAVRVKARLLRAEESELGEPAVSVTVRDEGPGIAPQYHRVIFEEFRQLESPGGRSFGGTGLGLALVKRFVELHRGRVSVESAPGAGSTFTVLLPVKAEAEAPAEQRLEPAPPDGAATVLVVEDEPDAYEAIARELARARLAPVRARTGEEALRLAKELQPAAITLDILLPGLDGWEVLKRLKEEPATRAIPVLIVSLMDNRELGLTLGADDYFLKPIDGEAFLQRIRELVPAAGAHGSRLLLVDDDPKLHDLLESLLAPCGYQLEHAYSGREGLAKAEEGDFDLVVLDLLMEGMDGFEVAGAFKGRATTASVPILVLTAKDLTLEEHRRLLDKVNALVQKGTASPAALVKAIRDLLARHPRRS